MTRSVSVSLATAVVACGAVAQGSPSAARLEGWLAETLRLDQATARACYERGAEGPDDAERALCSARLAELAAARGDRSAAERHLDAIEGADVPSAHREDLEAVANAHDQGTAGELGRDEARATLLARARERVRHPSTFEAVFEALRASQRAPFDDRRAWLRPRTNARRDWILIVERHLDGQHDAARRLASTRFGWEAAEPEGSAEDYVGDRLEVLANIKATQATDSLEHAVLARLEAHLEQLVEDGAFESAADLLRQIPLAGRQ